jgi:hypothetical protein
MTSFPKLRRDLRIAFWIFAAVILAVAIAFWLTGCGEESAEGPGCVGPVVEKFTEYKPGPGITSGNITIPTGSTKYSIIVEKADGSVCTKSLKRDHWVLVRVGDTYGEA